MTQRRRHDKRVHHTKRQLNGPLKISMNWRDAIKHALSRGSYPYEQGKLPASLRPKGWKEGAS